MKCTSIFLLTTLFSVVCCTKIVTVTVNQDRDQYAPSMISAPSNSTIRFLFPSRFRTIVQSTFDSPCTPRPGGFNSASHGGNLDAKGWDLHVRNSSQPLWFFYHNALKPNYCGEGTVGVINSPSRCKYAEFRRAARNNGPSKPDSTMMTPATQPTATTSNLPISSPTLQTHLSQPMTLTIPSPSPSPAQRNVGAIIGGTIVGALAGIIVLVLLANAAFLLYRWRKRNSDPEADQTYPAPQVPPPGAPMERLPENLPAALPGLVEMTEVSVAGDGMPAYQRISSRGTPLNNTLDASAAALQPSMQEVITPDPPTKRTPIRLSRSLTLSQIEMATGPLANTPPSVYLLPSDPFASTGQLPVDSCQDQQQQHMLQRTQSIRGHTRRQSQSDSLQPTQPTIPEQEMEFIAQEVMTFILTDSVLVDSPSSYSSPPAGVWSATPDYGQRSQILSYLQRSPTLGYSLPSLTLRRQLSRGSSMEGG